MAGGVLRALSAVGEERVGHGGEVVFVLGAVVCGARTIPDEFFLIAARTLAGLVEQSDLDRGSRIYLYWLAGLSPASGAIRYAGKVSRAAL